MTFDESSKMETGNMPSTPLRDQSIKITVHFERRDDGGLSIRSDDLPGLHLSHRDPSLVLNDVERALEVLLTDMLHERVRVEPLVGIREALSAEITDVPPTGTREYVTRPIAA